MNLLDATEHPVTLIGLDLAWGERRPDGICRLRFPEGVTAPPREIEVGLTHGDEALFSWLEERAVDERIFVTVDAPTIGPNLEGSRPVDRECSRLFRREEAGCHPVNRTLCRRPFRVASQFEERGFQLTAELSRGPRALAEVYPHPAMIRFFRLARTIKYKKGSVADRREAFRRYQEELRRFLEAHLPDLPSRPTVENLLSAPWTKDDEDRIDGFFCSLIGWWHLLHAGTQSEVLGDERTGSILLPNPDTEDGSPT